jgi:DNA processing protein
MSAPDSERLARVALCLAFEPADAKIAGMVSAQGAASTCGELLRRGTVDGAYRAAIARLDSSDPALHLDLAQRGGPPLRRAG